MRAALRSFVVYGGAFLLTALAVYGVLDLSGQNGRRDFERTGTTVPPYSMAPRLR